MDNTPPPTPPTPQETINNLAQQPPNPIIEPQQIVVPPLPPPPKSKKRPFIVIGIILLLIVIGGVLLFLVFFKQKNTNTNKQTTYAKPAVSEYKDEAMEGISFSFQYPENWKVNKAYSEDGPTSGYSNNATWIEPNLENEGSDFYVSIYLTSTDGEIEKSETSVYENCNTSKILTNNLFSSSNLITAFTKEYIPGPNNEEKTRVNFGYIGPNDCEKITSLSERWLTPVSASSKLKFGLNFNWKNAVKFDDLNTDKNYRAITDVILPSVKIVNSKATPE